MCLVAFSQTSGGTGPEETLLVKTTVSQYWLDTDVGRCFPHRLKGFSLVVTCVWVRLSYWTLKLCGGSLARSQVSWWIPTYASHSVFHNKACCVFPWGNLGWRMLAGLQSSSSSSFALRLLSVRHHHLSRREIVCIVSSGLSYGRFLVCVCTQNTNTTRSIGNTLLHSWHQQHSLMFNRLFKHDKYIYTSSNFIHKAATLFTSFKKNTVSFLIKFNRFNPQFPISFGCRL